MSYWRKVLEEVLNKHDPLYPMVFTSVKEYAEVRELATALYGKTAKDRDPPIHLAKKHTQLTGSTKQYELGNNYPNVYFTKREAQIMSYFLRGMNTVQVAKLLELSRRTVEFYVNNMKIKLDCRLKSELIRKVMESDFSKGLDF